MNNSYVEFKRKQEKELNAFPMKFAFSDEQFKASMVELGLTEADTDKVVSIGLGGFVRKTDLEGYIDLRERLNSEFDTQVSNDKTGEGFIKDMFRYELGNHEYAYTRDLEPTLAHFGYSDKDIMNNENLKNGLELAIKECIDWHNENS